MHGVNIKGREWLCGNENVVVQAEIVNKLLNALIMPLADPGGCAV
jgi:hypothetical protein